MRRSSFLNLPRPLVGRAPQPLHLKCRVSFPVPTAPNIVTPWSRMSTRPGRNAPAPPPAANALYCHTCGRIICKPTFLSQHLSVFCGHTPAMSHDDACYLPLVQLLQTPSVKDHFRYSPTLEKSTDCVPLLFQVSIHWYCLTLSFPTIQPPENPTRINQRLKNTAPTAAGARNHVSMSQVILRVRARRLGSSGLS